LIADKVIVERQGYMYHGSALPTKKIVRDHIFIDDSLRETDAVKQVSGIELVPHAYIDVRLAIL